MENRGAGRRERVLELQTRFVELVRQGIGAREFETVAMGLLREFEETKARNNAQIARIKEEIRYCEGTSHACDTFANLLIKLITDCRQTPKVAVEEKPTTPLDTDVLKTICVCGCQDAEDAAGCKCSCHYGVPCGQPNCVVCACKAEDWPPAGVIVTKKPRGRRAARSGDAGRDQTS